MNNNRNIDHRRTQWRRLSAYGSIAALCVAICLISFQCLSPTLPAEGGISLEEFDKCHADWCAKRPALAYFFGWGTLVIGTIALVGSASAAAESFSMIRYAVLSTSIAHTIVIEIKIDSRMTDALGHVNYISTIQNMDACRDAMMHRIGWTMEGLIKAHSIAFVMGTYEISYKSEMLLGDTITAKCEMARRSRSTMILRCEMFTDRNPDKPAVICRMTMPLVDLRKRKAMPIPEWLWGYEGAPPMEKSAAA